ncbi:hypothetical protein QBC40DRAFT_223130 [Triangularia verruculosa]|uniref:Uncharacterized protein n=1 Tax=Triangularia verruculosa TaxID=2587418 RepID=A0AAN6XJT6_9PEZI|nr:hypothetical protein QBC40DRAFT_223130 [Triangularia verruculosa]
MLLPRHLNKTQPHGPQATGRASRLRPPGLRIKTSSLDILPSDEKAQAMASADWRRMAPDSGFSDSHPQVTNENSRHNSEHNDDFYSPLVLEMKSMNSESKTQYRYPRGISNSVAWEAISSAPGLDLIREETRTSDSSILPSPIPQACEPSLQNTVLVRLKNIKQMDVNINGDIIKLPNKYSLDVTPVDIQEPDAARFMNRTSEDMLAMLKLLRPKARLRRMKSELHEEGVLEDLDCFLSQQRERPSKDTLSTNKVQHQRNRPSEQRSSHDSGISTSFESTVSQHGSSSEAPPKSTPEGERFRTLLSRLHLTADTKEATRPPPPPPPPSLIGESTTHARALDPAIIVAKVKDTGREEEAPASWQSREREKTFFGRDSSLLFGKGRQAPRSHDSGYSTFHPMQRNQVEPPRGKEVEHFAPSIEKRKEDSTSTSSTSTKLNPAAAEFKSITRDGLKTGTKTSLKPALEEYAVPPFTPKRLTRGSINDLYPGMLESSRGLGQPMLPPMMEDGPLNSPWKAIGPLDGLLWPPELRQSSFPEVAFQPPVAPVAMAPLPIVDPDGKGARPVFPVTQKPRDHDPVKQQAYESYLEWRKANEPGYHMKCKMRQAHRVVRQYQQQALTEDWKIVAGKAKAAAGALEAQAQMVEEKRKKARAAALQEQFKMSVKQVAESSRAEDTKEHQHRYHEEMQDEKQPFNAPCGTLQTLVV